MSKTTPREYKLKTGVSVIIRAAVPEDAQSLLKLFDTIVAEDEHNVTTAEDAKKLSMTIEKEQEWIQEHNKDGNVILVAEIGGAVAGMVNVENGNRQRIAHVGMLHVSILREFRKMGIGTALMQSTIDWAKQDPLIEKVTLEVFTTNQPAIGLYKKRGFLEEGRRNRQIKIADGEYVDDILMYRFVKD